MPEKVIITPRIRIVQKLYGLHMNPDESIIYPKTLFFPILFDNSRAKRID